MIDGASGITGNLDRFFVLCIDQNATAAMAHPAMSLDHTVVPVYLDLFFYV
jgi:hypothetical protein